MRRQSWAVWWVVRRQSWAVWWVVRRLGWWMVWNGSGASVTLIDDW